MSHELFQEYRCPDDDKLLFKGILAEGEIEIKCRFCKQLHTFQPRDLSEILCFKNGCINRVGHVQ